MEFTTILKICSTRARSRIEAAIVYNFQRSFGRSSLFLQNRKIRISTSSTERVRCKINRLQREMAHWAFQVEIIESERQWLQREVFKHLRRSRRRLQTMISFDRCYEHAITGSYLHLVVKITSSSSLQQT